MDRFTRKPFTRKPRARLGALIAMGTTLALAVGFGVLPGAGVAASSQNEPKNDTRPTISGSAQVGQTLTGTHGHLAGQPEVVPLSVDALRRGREWLLEDRRRNEHHVHCRLGRLRAHDPVQGRGDQSGRASFATSLATARVGSTAGGNPPVNTSLPTVSGTPRQGQVLHGPAGKLER